MPVRVKNRVVKVAPESILVETDGNSNNTVLLELEHKDYYPDCVHIKPGNEYRDGWLCINAHSLDDLISSLQSMRENMR